MENKLSEYELDKEVFRISQKINDLLKNETIDNEYRSTIVCAATATSLVTITLGCGMTKPIAMDCLSSTWDELEGDILELLAEQVKNGK